MASAHSSAKNPTTARVIATPLALTLVSYVTMPTRQLAMDSCSSRTGSGRAAGHGHADFPDATPVQFQCGLPAVDSHLATADVQPCKFHVPRRHDDRRVDAKVEIRVDTGGVVPDRFYADVRHLDEQRFARTRRKAFAELDPAAWPRCSESRAKLSLVVHLVDGVGYGRRQADCHRCTAKYSAGA